MLLTGMYPDHNGIVENCKIGREAQLKTDAECITDVYAKAGYEVAYFGKCHWQKTEPLFNKEGTYIGSAQSPGGELMKIHQHQDYSDSTDPVNGEFGPQRDTTEP